MAYTKTNWVNDGPPALSAENLNNMEAGIYNNDQQNTANTNSINTINSYLSGMIVTESKNESIALPASDAITTTFNMAKSGYTFLGVVGFRVSGTGGTQVYTPAAYKSGTNTATLQLRNPTATARTLTGYIYGLYVKNI